MMYQAMRDRAPLVVLAGEAGVRHDAMGPADDCGKRLSVTGDEVVRASGLEITGSQVEVCIDAAR